MFFTRLLIVLCLLAGWSHASNPITDYKCGITLTIQGQDGVDYAFERFYYDSLIDDHGVIYLKDSTRIMLTHNARNAAYIQSSSTPPLQVVGINGPDSLPNSGDEGIIRYKIDRDRQWKYAWGGDATHNFGPLLPACTAPFALRDLTFEPGVPVVGAIGPVPGIAETLKTNYYHRGLQDAFGDEWHIISIGDDDSWVPSGNYTERWSSDGKIYPVVVNPKTPLLFCTRQCTTAQYYTTPAKSYFVSRIHDQTTYVTDSVSIHLVNIMGGSIWYRFGSDAFTQYTGPINSSLLTSGTHTLEYYYDTTHHKTRTIVKNPDYPSRAEAHGNLLWKDQAEYNAIVARITSSDTARSAYTGTYNAYRTNTGLYGGNGQASWDASRRRGLRTESSFSLVNAFVARVAGPAARQAAGKPTYAAYAKSMVLENWLSIDPVGFELSHNFAPIPSREQAHFGYYAVNGVTAHAFAYDLLIGFYRADQQPGGITPIEDLKIRDQLATHVLRELYELGTNNVPDTTPGVGMWDMAKEVGALVIALAMPSYHTTYYGTSGFDGTTQTHTFTPYPTHPVTWKQAFYTSDMPLYGYPNQSRYFNHVQGGLITVNGDFFDRIGYYSYHLMGHCFQIMANVMKIKLDHSYPYLEKSFQRANNGYLVGLKNPSEGRDSTTAGGYQLFPQMALINERFPAVAETAWQNIRAGKFLYNGHPMTLGEAFYSTGIYGLLWYHDDWKTVGITAPDRTGRITVPPAPFLGAQPCRGRLTNSWPQAIEVRSLRDELVAVLQVSESTSLMSGVYYVRSTDGKYLHKLVVIEP